MRAKLRTPKNRASKGFVVVLPILGGDYGPSDAFATHLAGEGFITVRFDRKTRIFHPERGYDHVAKTMRDGVVDIRRGVDWAIATGRANRGVGVLGISLGSFAGTVLTAVDPRIDCAVLALGGGGLSQVLQTAKSEPEIGAFLKGMAQRVPDKAERARQAKLHLDPVDPIHFAGRLHPEKTLFVHARFDAVVPYSRGTRLWEAAGQPPRVTLLTGHYSAVLALPYLLSLTASHFERYLSGPG